jgi:hypothetical protein
LNKDLIARSKASPFLWQKRKAQNSLLLQLPVAAGSGDFVAQTPLNKPVVGITPIVRSR